MIETITNTPWLIRFRSAPQARTRLVCLPHAGGSASFYFPMTRTVAPDTDVLAVQYPGRQDRRSEPCLTDLGQLADEVASALEPWLDLPTVLFGHSMGATLAFEVARRLERNPEFTPRRIIASGRRAPSTHRDESVHKRDDDGIIAEMRLLSGTDPRILADEEFLRMAMPAIRGDYTAIETYRVEPGAKVRAPITVLTGDTDVRTSAEEAAAWRQHTTGDFELHTFAGGHFFLADHLERVGGIVSDSLL
ncbi:thioesterase II family protein [Streptomyces sp. NRRL S-920]|uniref:thioesterase II family protein n=1 Tax=Streptomyces sp. NRRL S-920 TaxID=1463921 RepID=UPI0004CC74E9|nr:alpha/beta fold hydrolase [Streptomyces sp. NRRL S-920]